MRQGYAMTRILIRTDIGGTYGLGRASRMRALAHALAARGATVTFTTSTPALAALVTPLPCVVYETPAADMIIVDTTNPEVYGELHTFREFYGGPIVFIDRMPHNRHDADLLIFPNAHQPPATLVQAEAACPGRVLHGWEYVMLDPAVTQNLPIPYTERVNGPIVFCAGGSDPDGALAQMAKWCELLTKTTDWVFLLADRPYPYGIGGQYPWATCRSFVHDGWKYIREASLVVSMFGQTVYDALWHHTSVVAFPRTAADAYGIQQLQQAGVNALMGSALPVWPAMTQQQFSAIVMTHMHEVLHHGMHAASVGLMDGHGVERVANAILGLC